MTKNSQDWGNYKWGIRCNYLFLKELENWQI